jgi:hypothetical protein
MLINNKFPYQVQDSENGMFVEIYLPKKSHFQGTLYDTLTKGFNISDVKKHLLDTKKQPSILKLLSLYAVPIISKGFKDDRINKMEQIFWGYSLYEVDGVFSNFKDGKITVTEERTQIIRIMFVPNIEILQDAIMTEGIEESSSNLTRLVHKIFLADEIEAKKLSSEYKLFPLIIKYLEDWTWDITLFLFGYIIYEICEKIKNLSESGDITPEDEIWVTSFWNFQISRIKNLKQSINNL